MTRHYGGICVGFQGICWVVCGYYVWGLWLVSLVAKGCLVFSVLGAEGGGRLSGGLLQWCVL